MRIALRVKPGASRAKVGGSHPGRYGPALVVAVTAPAVNGRATEAALRAVAAALGVAHREVTLISGDRSRDKLIEIRHAGPELSARLAELLDG